MSSTNQETQYVPVSMEAVWQDKNGFYDAKITRISEGDCFFESSAKAANGEPIQIKFKLPSGHWFSLKGIVCSVDESRGFQALFIDLSIDNRIMLSELVSSYGKSEVRLPKLDLVYNEPKRQARILLADDDRVVLRTLEAIVEKHGYEPVVAADGLEAYNLLSTDGDFDATMFDMFMPHLKGIDLVRYMRQDEDLMDIPVGVITAQEDPKLWDQSLAAGADVFLPKPFSAPQVTMMLDMMIGKHFVHTD
ncbi:MAG: response regulator [Pyrinomonadaceae bacterium]|nr:response regulator [Pyrinomonadaceae bacterium]